MRQNKADKIEFDSHLWGRFFFARGGIFFVTNPEIFYKYQARICRCASLNKCFLNAHMQFDLKNQVTLEKNVTLITPSLHITNKSCCFSGSTIIVDCRSIFNAASWFRRRYNCGAPGFGCLPNPVFKCHQRGVSPQQYYLYL